MHDWKTRKEAIFIFAVALAVSVSTGCQAGEKEHMKNPEIKLTGDGVARAVFAGGCFWCMESPFEKLKGVRAVISGYTGGPEEHPTYEQVSAGMTGHREAIVVEFDPEQIEYDTLLDVFWKNINPVQKDGQFYDRGPQYRTAIYFLNDRQKAVAIRSKERLQSSGIFKGPIVTEILEAGRFWKAEEYHQDYYKKNPVHYHRYREGSGRDAFIRAHWKN